MSKWMAITQRFRVVIVTISCLLLAFGVSAFWEQQVSEAIRPGTLPYRARELKAKGIDKERLPVPIIPEYPSLVGGFDQFATECDAVVVATMTDKRFRLSADTERIETVAKFHVDEFLAGTIVRARTQASSQSMPFGAQSLALLKDDEILILLEGGTLKVDGVLFQHGSYGYPPLVVGKQYLLFLDIIKPAPKVGNYYGGKGVRLYATSLGTSGVYPVEPGEAVPSLRTHGMADPDLRKELEKRFLSRKDFLADRIRRVGRPAKVEWLEEN